MKFKLFLPLVICLSLFFGVFSFASDYDYELTNVDSLNDQIIANWNDMSNSAKLKIIKQMIPSFTTRMGVRASGLKYDAMYSEYEYLRDNNLLGEYAINPATGQFFTTFDELLLARVVNRDQRLVFQSPAIDTTKAIIDNLASEELSTNGIQITEVVSYTRMNSSLFRDITIYNSFISLCENYSSLGYKYVLPTYNSSENKFYFAFVSSDFSLYRNGVSGNYGLTSSGANSNFSYTLVTITSKGVVSSPSTVNGNFLFVLGAVGVLPSWNSGGSPLTADRCTKSIFTLNNTNITLNLFTSLSGWINGHGHFEPSFIFNNQWGNVPTLTYDSHDLSNVYYTIINNNNSTNIDNSNSGNTTIIYPPANYPGEVIDPSEPHKIDFTDITSLINSIGDFIGSILRNIATGIANILQTIVNIVRNITNVFSNNPILDFIKSFLVWLPEPFDSVVYALFSLSILFGVLRLVKGAFS